MKLLYVFPEPLPLDRARGIQAVYTVRALAQQGIEVLLAYVPSTGDPFGACSIEKPGNVTMLPIPHRLPWPLGRVHSNRIFASRLASALRGQGVEAIMARHLKAARFLIERFPRLPLLYEAHEVFADTAPEGRRDKTARLEQFVAQQAAVLVANSGATAKRLSERYGIRKTIHVIPNGVEYPEHVPEKDWANAGSHVVYAGSFFGWKGVDDLVAAAGRLSGARIKLIGGDAAGIARLRAQTSPSGAELRFTGRLPHEQVASELLEACIAVLPNRADPDSVFTSPIKLFEYMAAGCALVVSDLPAIREILSGDEAQWVPAGDAEALAQAIRSLIADPERARAMAALAREKARRFTWRARGERLAGLLRPLAASRTA